jgi:adenosylhomocysteinase
MDGSFANQVLAQMHLRDAKFADLSPADKQANLWLRILPKKLDEEVAADMVAGFGGVITKLTSTQASYINLPSVALLRAQCSQFKCFFCKHQKIN